MRLPESIINGNNLSVSQKEFIAKGIERIISTKIALKVKKLKLIPLKMIS